MTFNPRTHFQSTHGKLQIDAYTTLVRSDDFNKALQAALAQYVLMVSEDQTFKLLGAREFIGVLINLAEAKELPRSTSTGKLEPQ